MGYHDLPSHDEGDVEEPALPGSPIQLLKNLQKIVPRSFLDDLPAVVAETTHVHSDTDTKGSVRLNTHRHPALRSSIL